MSDNFQWTSPEGLVILRDIIEPILPFTADDDQLYDSACVLDGRDVACISATGSGKTAVIYIAALVDKDMISVVVEPTNLLEDDMSKSMAAKGITSVVINAEHLAREAKAGRDLWAEAKAGKFQVIALAPESLRKPEFIAMMNDDNFRKRWKVADVDEAHLVSDWGPDFRNAYEDIWTLRALGPKHLTFVALSATLEPGRQTDRVFNKLGFVKGKYHLDRRDCERHNVNYIFRAIRYAHTTHQFRDLDWLVPEHMTKASDIPKFILFSDTIETGHRIAVYLRSLLPPQLQNDKNTLIRHMHSMTCPDCKQEGITALYDTEETRQTAGFVATSVMELGIDPPDVRRVIIFPGPSTASSLVQRAGRVVRAIKDANGDVFTYITDHQCEQAREYVEENPTDERILTAKDEVLVNIDMDDEMDEGQGDETLVQEGSEKELEDDVEMGDRVVLGGEDGDEGMGEIEEIVGRADEGDGVVDEEDGVADEDEDDREGVAEEGEDDEETDVDDNAPSEDSEHATTDPATRHRKQRKTRKPTKTSDDSKKKKCHALLLIIAAWDNNRCIQRQTNIIFNGIDAVGTHQDCGRCSACVGDVVPEPRPLKATVRAPTSPQQTGTPNKATDTTPKYLRLTRKDIKYVAERIIARIQEVRLHSARNADLLCVRSSQFLSKPYIDAITKNFHLLTSSDELKKRLVGWRYWDVSGSALWVVVESIGIRKRLELLERHEQQKEKRREKERQKRSIKQSEVQSISLEQDPGENENGESMDKRDAAKTKEYLAENGLTHFKKVTLNLGSQRTSTPRSSTPDPLAQKPVTPFSPNNRLPSSTNPKRGSESSPPSSPSKRQRVYPNATMDSSSSTNPRSPRRHRSGHV